MKTDDKVKITNALIDIKLVLAAYNNFLNNGSGFENDDYEPLKKAFDGVNDIAKIIRTL